jgi:hypothetical protein
MNQLLETRAILQPPRSKTRLNLLNDYSDRRRDVLVSTRKGKSTAVSVVLILTPSARSDPSDKTILTMVQATTNND